MRFTKMQGTGNDFVVVEASDTETNWGSLAVAMCDRHFGVGADGLLLLCPSDVAGLGLRIFNADGSEARACGNGTRCIVKYYVDKNAPGKVDGKLTVETIGGVRDAWYFRRGNEVDRVRVGMGAPQPVVLSPSLTYQYGGGVDIILYRTVAVSGVEITLDLVSLGNTHAVHFTEEPLAEYPLSRIGRALDHELLPGGVNFEVARVVDRRGVEVRVWEHGVGETLACGSGACAVAVAAHLRGLIEKEVEVRLAGGKLIIEWDGRSEVFLTGAAKTVFCGEWLGRDESESREVEKPMENEVLA